MGTFTRLDDQAVADLADAFDLGEVRAWRAIAAGTVNSNFCIESQRGRFFFRVNEGKSDADVHYEAYLVNALAAAGLPTPPCLSTRDGAPFARRAGKPVTAFPWVAGAHCATRDVTPAVAEAVGRGLAQFHCLADELPPPPGPVPPGHYGAQEIARRFESFHASRDPELVPAIRALTDELHWLGQRAELRAGEPTGVIHGDLFRDNVLFDEDRITALLDFEQASQGSRTYDLAVCLNAWCFGDDFAPECIAAMLGGYVANPRVPSPRPDALYAECRAAALRFTVTRITDCYLRPTSARKDFRRFLARLERWRALGADVFVGRPQSS